MKLSLQNSHTLDKIRGYVTYVFYPKSKLMKDTVQFVGFNIKSGKKNISCWERCQIFLREIISN